MKPILITLMVCLFGGLNAFGQVDTSRNDGYLSVISYDDGFVAAGTGGRVDWFSTDGVFIQNKQIPNLDIHDLLFLNGTLYVAGNQGALFYSNDGHFFKKIDTKLTSTIHALIEFQGQIIAGTNQGLILVGDEHQEFSPVQLPLLGNVVALSANKTWCYGVTDQGEIFHSKDGKDWKVLNFNREYHGYYQPCQFNGVLVTDNSIAVIGKHEDNTPALFFSSEGNVWTERMLTYVNDNGQSVLLKELPRDILYDANLGEFLLGCSGGKLMVIPSCSHCNKLYDVSLENIHSIARNARLLVLVGSRFFMEKNPYFF
jgi:hypothetical protein